MTCRVKWFRESIYAPIKEPGFFYVAAPPVVAINTSQDDSGLVPGRTEEEMRRENDILIVSYEEGS